MGTQFIVIEIFHGYGTMKSSADLRYMIGLIFHIYIHPEHCSMDNRCNWLSIFFPYSILVIDYDVPIVPIFLVACVLSFQIGHDIRLPSLFDNNQISCIYGS